jgi:peptidyl-dipeptidase A
MTKIWLGILMFPFLMSCAESQQALQARVDEYLKNYTSKYKNLSYAVAEAEWALNTHIVEGDSTNAVASRRAKQALAEFSGSTENITTARVFGESHAVVVVASEAVEQNSVSCGRQPSNGAGPGETAHRR